MDPNYYVLHCNYGLHLYSKIDGCIGVGQTMSRFSAISMKLLVLLAQC